MKKEWFFDRFCGERIAICAEDGKIVDVALENEWEKDVVGNIYKGKVANVLPGMQAAFVNCGLERNCYLPLHELAAKTASYDGEGNPGPVLSLKEGDEVLVQVEQPPRGNKGAKVTAALSIVGKTLIYLPQADFLGISRKITDEPSRTQLLEEADKLRGAGEGFIVRTAAAGASRRRLRQEAEYLKRVFRSVLEAAQNAPVGAIVYREYDLPVKIMRDSFGDDVNRIYVGDRELYEKLLPYMRMRSDLNERKLTLYTGEKSLFTAFGLNEQIYALASTRADVGNGAYLIIDRTEAMTVIDVNTGGFTGNSHLEHTVFEVNLLAAREIARQVRLRNIGGIVAVDFIDMTEEEHRAAVSAELESALSNDKAKCRVQPMSDLCVTLFTRKRTNRDLLSFLLKPCPHCTRAGFVLSDKYMEMRIRSAILDCFSEGYRAAIVELNRGLMETILSERVFHAELETVWKERRIYMIPHSGFHEEKFTVRGDNSDVLTLPDTAQILY